jgi:ABC-type bacteriocin/lantibiotic exporter with double-glycine peptidase domain
MAILKESVSLSGALKKFFQVIRLEKKEVSAIYFYSILSGLIQLSLPLGIQAIINFAQAAAGSGRLPVSIGILIALVLGGVLVAGILQVNQMKIIEKIQQRLFTRYAFEFSFKIPRVDSNAINHYHFPELVNRFFETVTLQKGLSKFLLDIPMAIIQILFGLILLSFYNPTFIFLGLLLFMLLYLVLYFTAKRGLAESMNESDYKYKVAGWMQEVARAFKSFKVSGMHNLHLKKTDEYLEGYIASKTAHFKTLAYQYWSLIIFKLLISATMLIIGSVLLVNQQLNVGQFIAAEIVILLVLNAVEKLILNLENAYDLLTGLEKISKITDQPSESEGNIKFESTHSGITISSHNIDFSYDEGHQVLKDININIASGQKVCIMGDAASGKSTLMELLTGNLKSFEGNLLINNIPINNLDMDSYRRHIGVFYDEQDIFYASLMDNICMGNTSITANELMQLADVIGLKEYINQLPNGLDTMLEPTGKGLSTIIAKKVLLLRTIVNQPKLLLLDEPFELAGAESSKNISDYLLTLKNITTVVITGYKPFAEKADLVIWMDHGKIKHMGSPSEVFTKHGIA